MREAWRSGGPDVRLRKGRTEVLTGCRSGSDVGAVILRAAGGWRARHVNDRAGQTLARLGSDSRFSRYVLAEGSCPIAWCRSVELLDGSDRHVRLR
jgi:hypothetical protein